MKMLLLRPYYGININNDMHGDLGIADHLPLVFPDLSFIYAATIAKQADHVNLDVIDANGEKIFPSEVMKRLDSHYDIIILKSAAPSVQYDISFAKMLKHLYPSSKLCFSGHVAKILSPWIKKNVEEIDEVIEEPLENFVFKYLHNTKTAIELDAFPTPDYSLFPYMNYLSEEGTVRGCIHMSRGCAVGCNYCPYTYFYGTKFEFRSIDKVIDDIESLIRLGITTIQFRDQFFGADKKSLYEFCCKVKEKNLKFKWRCESKLESYNIETLEMMVDIGMELICFGVESASVNILNSFGRPSPDFLKLKNLIEYLRSRNVETLAFYIVGFPDETWSDIDKTVKLALDLGTSQVKFSIYTPNLNKEIYKLFPGIEISPDLFVPFENRVNINCSKHLTIEELNFLIYQAQTTHAVIAKGLKTSYEDHFVFQRNNIIISEKMKACISEKSIIEI